jgi:hypothetical protein
MGGISAHLGEMRNVYKILVGIPEANNHLIDLGVGGRIIMTLIKIA